MQDHHYSASRIAARAGDETQRQAGPTFVKFKPILRRAPSPRINGLVEIQGETVRLIYMKLIAKPGSFGSMRSATDGRFTKKWLTDCAKPAGVIKRPMATKPEW